MSSPAKFSIWAQIPGGQSMTGRFRLVLGLLGALLLAWLIFGAAKPWHFDVANAKSWRLREIIGFYTFWAGAINVGLLAALAVTARWWAGEDRVVSPPPASASRRSRFFWIAVGAATVFSGTSAWQRMDFGFAHDEDLATRRAVVGEYRIKSGEVIEPKLDWENTLYYYKKPTNHVFHSLLARLSWTAWRAVTPASEWQVREWVVRTPAWIAGTLSVLVLGLLAARLGGDRAGIWAAWLLAIHPWLIRYSSEARGYSLVLLLMPALVLFWSLAVQRNLWRWWLAFAFSQLALLWSYPAAVYVLFTLNGLSLVWLGWRYSRSSEDTRLFRWFAANTMAAIAAIQAMLPLLPQLQHYLATEAEAKQPLSLFWLANTASNFLVAVPWTKTFDPNPIHLELMPYAQTHLAGFVILVLALMIFGLIGFLRLLKQDWPESTILTLTLILPAFLAAVVAWAIGQWLYEWYLIYLLPGLILAIAIGVDAASRRLIPIRILSPVPGVLLLLGYAAFTQPFRHRIISEPVDHIRDVVTAMRGTTDATAPTHHEILTASFLSHLSYYDPRVEVLETREQFLALMKRADQENKPLVVEVCHPWAAVFQRPDVWRLFYESGLFKDFREFYGLENMQDRLIATYQPGTVEDFPVDAFFRDRTATPDPMIPPLAYPSRPPILTPSP